MYYTTCIFKSKLGVDNCNVFLYEVKEGGILNSFLETVVFTAEKNGLRAKAY